MALAGVHPAGYPESAPFHPSLPPPEYPFSTHDRSEEPNPVYDAVRSLWLVLGWDETRVGTASWNPLGHLVGRGDRVLVKPNLIAEENRGRAGSWQEVITHPSVLRAVIDYALIALDGKGRVVVADGPQTDSDFDAIRRRSGLEALVRFYADRGAPVTLLDLRRDLWQTTEGLVRRRTELPGDPEGYVHVDLASRSAFVDYALSGQFYGADYDVAETREFHADQRHEYVLCRSALSSDVLINVPKLKTHKKTGITVSLKNLVGVNGYRNCLPHYTVGPPREGGDEFPDGGWARRLESRLLRHFRRRLVTRGGIAGPWALTAKRAGRAVFGDTGRVVRSGNWEGNDTSWRMVLDLNQVVLWFDETGAPRRQPRRFLSVVDGVVAGEGDGPLSPAPVAAGVLLAGTNPWAVDRVAAARMGLRLERIPMIHRPGIQPESYEWLLPDGPPRVLGAEASPAHTAPRFRPHFGWPSLAP